MCLSSASQRMPLIIRNGLGHLSHQPHVNLESTVLILKIHFFLVNLETPVSQ